MSFFKHICFTLLFLILATGCSKNLLDKDLNYNPFDPEYVGESPFELVSATPFTVVEAGTLKEKIRVRFSVNQSLFTSEQPFYYVLVEDDNGEQQTALSSFSAGVGYFEYEYEHPHESACIYLYLQSGLSNSSRFNLCFTI